MSTDIHDPKLFLATIKPWAGSYSKVRIRYAAIKSKQGLLLCWYSATLVGPTEPGDFTPFKHISKSIVCGNTEVDFTQSWVVDLFIALEAGEVQIDGQNFIFILNQNQKPNYYVSQSYSHDFEQSERRASVQISGGQFGNSKCDFDHDLLQWEVRGATPPYDDIAEILNLAGIRRDVFSSQISSPTAEVEAHVPAYIAAGSTVKDGKASVVIRASSKTSRSDYSISFKTVSKHAVCRHGDISAFTWKNGDGHAVGSLDIRTDEAAQVHVFLKFKGEAIGHKWLHDPHKYINPLLAIYETYDSDSETLSRMLFEAKRDGVSFEHGVGLLLSTLGLTSSHHGAIKKLQDGPDLIALVPGVDVVLVVECTTDVLDKNDKLSRLVSRSRALVARLEESKFEYLKILPVIVSALPKSQLNTSIETAADNGVAIVNREVLQAWMEKRHDPPDPRAILMGIQSLIPRKANDLFGGVLEEPKY